MKDAYCSDTTAEMLRENGCDWGTWECNGEVEMYKITHQLAVKWLREEKGIHVIPFPGDSGFYYYVSIFVEVGKKWYNRIAGRYGRKAYEEAVSFGIQYSLTNLI